MILVTGSTGLAGSHLLQELTSQGKHVRALHRKNSNKDFVRHVFNAYAKDAEKQLSLIEWVEGDVLDIYSLEEAMRGIKKVYHNAAVVSLSAGDRKLLAKVNTEGTANVVNAALEEGIEKLCHVSSIAALGRANQDGITDETTDWVTSRHNSYYAISKFNAEREVWRGSVEGLRTVIVLPSVILGLTDINNSSMKLFKTILKGLPFYTHGSNGYVDARDLAYAQVMLMESGINNEKFLVTSENLSYKEVLGMIARGLGKRPPFIGVNQPMATLAWSFFKAKGLLTGKAPIITRETAATAMRKYTYSNRKIKEATGMEFRPVSETISDLCKIFRENDFFRK